MTKKILRSALLVGTTVALLSFDLPTGWFKAGDQPKSYEMGTDKGAGQDGKNAATIKSIDKSIKGFGTLMQNCLPGKYLGKRVRMSGLMKSKDVTEWAGFWFRVDQVNSQGALSFDNMQDRAIKGTTDWKKYEIVLDVPTKASNLAYGALLSGTGQIWFSNLKFEVVDNTVPTTDNGKNNMPLSEPTNLDFEK
ncbi:MAG: hypothetical protein WD077_01875 [Bacteroidia bacterium]